MQRSLRVRCARALLVGALAMLSCTQASAQQLGPNAEAPVFPGKGEEAAFELQRGNTAKAIAAYTEALNDTGLANDRRGSLLTDRAVAYGKVGDAALALADYNRALQLAPENPQAYNNRGNLLVNLGQYQEAIKDFDRAVLLAPKYAAAYSNRANAKLKMLQTREAIVDFTRAIELAPQSAPQLSGRGLAHLAEGKPHAAIRDFSRAVNADARFASAYRNRAQARLAVGQSDEALEDLSRASAFDTTNAELYRVRGYAYLNAGNVPSALKDFTRAIELAPQAVAGFEARGLAHALADATEEAFGDLNRAIELDPRSATAFAFRAFLYRQLQQFDVALKDLDTAMKLDPSNADVLWVAGEVEEGLAHGDAAIVSLRKSLAAKPRWRPAEDALKRLGVPLDVGADRTIANAGTGSWKVVMQGGAYFAISADYPALRVPLEMMGEGAPKLLHWQSKEAPYKGYGVLTFAAGQLITPQGPEATEQAAIIDIDNAKVIGIQPHRLGAKVATWTWDEDRVQVASIDGVTDEFALRTQRVSATDAAVAAAVPTGLRRPQGGWAQSKRQAQKRAPKPKSLFDLLFN